MLSNISNSINVTTLIVNLGSLLTLGFGFYKFIGVRFDKAIDDRIEPAIRAVHDRIDSHMDDEESALKIIAKSHKKVMKRLVRLDRQVNAEVFHGKTVAKMMVDAEPHHHRDDPRAV